MEQLKTVKHIHGKVLSAAGTPVDAVIEIYRHKRPEEIDYDALIEEKLHKIAACLSTPDGSFCFAELPSGKYLLRAGTRNQEDLNEAYVEIIPDRRWWSRFLRSDKSIELTLTPGT